VELDRASMGRGGPGDLTGCEATVAAGHGRTGSPSFAATRLWFARPAVALAGPVLTLALVLAPVAVIHAAPEGVPAAESGDRGAETVPDRGTELSRAGEIDARPEPATDVVPVELERLLQLPDGFGTEPQTRGGATASRWRGRFQRVREDLAAARAELEQVEKQLESASESSSAWQVSAPGSDSPETSPLSFRLRQQVKDQRSQIEASERQLRALQVEADLAQVPSDWRE
jgi:hypothetical protein